MGSACRTASPAVRNLYVPVHTAAICAPPIAAHLGGALPCYPSKAPRTTKSHNAKREAQQAWEIRAAVRLVVL
eukprot:CAMPEP_0179324700 /NCGR_PEP_ID=MMETSP0797-20121207/60447_1 /TAXON_ID=47934 /ORGANISM="Dinophysis acuminata, Strain DAEP01" /LENGTH=72 /DNA_ID=CAMNT_0021036733 /DNA_START=69 /DNA_END=285 /DNA_ORIENTATION=+